MFLILSISIVFLYFITLYLLNGGIQPKGAPRIYRGWIPFVGEAVSVAKTTLHGLVEKYSKENNGIFTVHLFGKNYTYVTDPEAYSKIWKDSNVGFGPASDLMGERLRGFKEKTAKPLTNEELEERSDMDRKNGVQNLMGNELNNLTINYQALSDEKIEKLTTGNSSFNLLDFTRKVVYYASSKSLLEPDFDADGTIDDFFYFDDKSKLLILGVPEIFLPKVVQARKNVTKEIARIDLHKCSKVVQSYALFFDDKEMVNSKAMNLLFASQTNSVNSSFWLLLYVLKHSEVKERIIQELKHYDPKDISSIDKMETLNNAFWEAARVAEYPVSFREVLEDTKVQVYGKEYTVPKGNMIMIWPINHFDEKLWENPQEFNPDRHKNLSKQARQSFIPFGGGKHLCPGRYFAMNEAKLFTISMLQKFDMKLDNTKFPEKDIHGAGFLYPMNDITVFFSKK